MIDITGLDKAEVLTALVNAATPPADAKPYTCTTVQAQAMLDDAASAVNVVNGRQIHANVSADSFDETEYDSHNGTGAAAAAVDSIR